MNNGGFSKSCTHWVTFYRYKGLSGLIRAYRKYRKDTEGFLHRKCKIERKALKVECVEMKSYKQPYMAGISADRRSN